MTRVEPDDAWLLEHGVEPNMGSESLPLWLPLPDWAGVSARDDTRAVDAGLAPGRERQLVAAWRAR